MPNEHSGNSLQAAIELIERDINDRMVDLRKLEAARDYLRAVLSGQMEMAAVLPAHSAQQLPAEKAPRPAPLSLAGEGIPITDAAARVLGAVGEAMSAEDLGRAMLAAGYRYSKSLTKLQTTVRGVLGRDVRTNPRTVFARPERGRFGLREWYSPEQLMRMDHPAGTTEDPAASEIEEEAEDGEE